MQANVENTKCKRKKDLVITVENKWGREKVECVVGVGASAFAKRKLRDLRGIFLFLVLATTRFGFIQIGR